MRVCIYVCVYAGNIDSGGGADTSGRAQEAQYRLNTDYSFRQIRYSGII